jgi:hypothetical protein
MSSEQSRRIWKMWSHVVGTCRASARPNLHAARGVAIREPLYRATAFADYLYIDGKAAGVIEADKAGVAFAGFGAGFRLSIAGRYE